jgi:branched-chain amino acid transport system substrate-binding protein
MAVLLAAATMPAPVQAEILIGVAAPLTGRYQARGLEAQHGAELAVAEINRTGGLLGRQLRLVPVDDGCHPGQATAAAHSLVNSGVRMVVGHTCSGAAIAAAPVYEQARIFQISPSATNPQLTADGWDFSFRVCGRDDTQGRLAGDLLADRWGDGAIAILHDRSTYGRGLAEETRRRLAERGVEPVLFLDYAPDALDFSGLVEQLFVHLVEAVYVGGRESEIALIVLQARRQGLEANFISGDALVSTDFWQIAGPAAEGAMFTFSPDVRNLPAAAALPGRLGAGGTSDFAGFTLHAYAAVQAWAQAVRTVGSLEPDAVREALQRERFDTVLGTLGFDENGDVVGIDTYIWYEWHDGAFHPAD